MLTHWFGPRSQILSPVLVIAALFAAIVVPTPIAVGGGLPCRYDVTAVIDGPFADDIVRGQAINNHNEVCGYFRIGFSDYRPFYWTSKGGFVLIPLPPGSSGGQANDISDAGLVVGVVSFDGGPGGNLGFIHDIQTGQTTFLDSGVLQGQCEITGVNESGIVCGFRSVNDGGDPLWPTTAFRWTATAGFEDMTPAGESQAADINEASTVTGWWGVNGERRAFRWGRGTPVVLPKLSGIEHQGIAIDDEDVIVGKGTIPSPPLQSGLARAVRWDGKAQVTNLGIPAGFMHSFALDVSPQGTIVGYANDMSGERALIWQGPVRRDLNIFVDSSVIHLSAAKGITDQQHILVDGAMDDLVCVIMRPQDPVPGDANGSCTVNVQDLLMVINQWGGSASSIADLDDSGVVDVHDLVIVLDHWTF